MTHTELIKTLAKKLDLRTREAAILWQETNKILARQLASQDKVRIKNFGAFVLVRHKSRTVPDPRRPEEKLVILDQLLPKFRPSEELRAILKEVKPRTPRTTSNKTSGLATAGFTEIEPEVEVTIPKVKEQPKTETKDKIRAEPTALNAISYRIAKKYQMVPLTKDKTTIKVAMADPEDKEAINFLAHETGLQVIPVSISLPELEELLGQYNPIAATLANITDLDELPKLADQPSEGVADNEEDAPATKIVTSLLEQAVADKASDIHLEPEEDKVTIRFRIDGVLENVLELPKNVQASVTSRLKIMANLKIDETRLPQDGRIRLKLAKHDIDFRVSTLPTVNGEKVVMRILDKTAGILSFDELGLTGENLKRVEDNITKAHGMVLVTGPTGSGKTTTLYAVIDKIHTSQINIVTLEDPVEYRISGINQSEVASNIGYDFASGLRSIVRQDPDVILVGEIRDGETATMAIHSALTGHIVLSTLHTNDSAGAIPRLIDMGIEPFLITSSTNAILAQRLVRKICPDCRVGLDLPEETLGVVRAELAKIPPKLQPKVKKLTFFKGRGCTKCNQTGYVGRIGIFEVLPISEAIQALALKKVSSSEIVKQAMSEGMITMLQDGILKALDGQTTLEEVWRVTKE